MTNMNNRKNWSSRISRRFDLCWNRTHNTLLNIRRQGVHFDHYAACSLHVCIFIQAIITQSFNFLKLHMYNAFLQYEMPFYSNFQSIFSYSSNNMQCKWAYVMGNLTHVRYKYHVKRGANIFEQVSAKWYTLKLWLFSSWDITYKLNIQSYYCIEYRRIYLI